LKIITGKNSGSKANLRRETRRIFLKKNSYDDFSRVLIGTTFSAQSLVEVRGHDVVIEEGGVRS
jgi:hypothetical protein